MDTFLIYMIAIFSALKDEIKSILADFEVTETIYVRPSIIFRGFYRGKEMLLSHTGIGRQKTERAVEFCIKEFHPDLCVNVGFCGALTPSLGLADIVIGESVTLEKSGEVIGAGENDFLNKAKTICKNVPLKCLSGGILTVDNVINTPHEKAFLGTKFGVVAVDMESFALAKTATKYNTPFIIVRSTIDPMDMHLGSFEGSVKENGSVNPVGFISNLVRSPKKTIQLPQLKFCASKAKETLGRFLNEFIL